MSKVIRVLLIIIAIIGLIIIAIILRGTYEFLNHVGSKGEYSILDVTDNAIDHSTIKFKKLDTILYKEQWNFSKHLDIGSFGYCILCIYCENSRRRTLALLNPQYKQQENKILWGLEIKKKDMKKERDDIEVLVNQYLKKYQTRGCEYDFIFSKLDTDECCIILPAKY